MTISIDAYCQAACDYATTNGFHDSPANADAAEHVLELAAIAKMHEELGELTDALRHGNPESKKIPGFSHAEEELADLVIRVFDWCGHKGYRLQDAIDAKMAYNLTRPFRHGKAS